MAGPRWFVGVDSLMEFVAFIIALAIAYQAFKGSRLTKQRTFWYVYLSFAVLSAGLLIDSLAGFVAILARMPRGTVVLTQVGYGVYFLAQLLAYGLLIYAYASQSKNLSGTSNPVLLASMLAFATLQTAPAFPIGLLGFQLEYHPIAEIVLLFLVTYIAVHTGMNYSATKDRNALLVFLAFFFLSLSHLFFILVPIGPSLFVIGHLLQLSGFAALLAMLLRVTASK